MEAYRVGERERGGLVGEKYTGQEYDLTKRTKTNGMKRGCTRRRGRIGQRERGREGEKEEK